MDPDPPHGECLCRRWLGTAADVGRDPEAPVSAVSPPPRRRRPCRRTGPMQGAGARSRPASFRRGPGDMPGGGRQSTSVLPLHPQRSDSGRQTCARARAGQGCVVSTTSASACATCQRRSGGIKRCWDCNTSARPAPRLCTATALAANLKHAAATMQRAPERTSPPRDVASRTRHTALAGLRTNLALGCHPRSCGVTTARRGAPAAALSCFGGWAPELCRNHEHYHWRPELSPHSWVLRGVSWPWAAGGGVAATRGLADADHEPQWPVTWPARHVACPSRVLCSLF